MKVAIITGSRADWNGLGMVGMTLRDEHKADVRVVCIGQQASHPCPAIASDGFKPSIVTTDTGFDIDVEVAVSTGRATDATAKLLDQIRPDVAVVLGDRFEILGTATAVALLRIPIAHIGGGDITEGSIDNKLRYAITALADVHFTTNLKSYQRLDEASIMGGIYNIGNPALDRIRLTKTLSKAELFKALGLSASRHNILVAYHSATLEDDPLASCMELTKALKAFDKDSTFLVLGTNTDTGSAGITKLLRRFADDVCYYGKMVDNLSPQHFYSCLQHFDYMVGNSSAGIVETAGFGIPVVNIGPLQIGRDLPENALSCEASEQSIVKAINIAMEGSRHPATNPYGNGYSAPRIAKVIANQVGGRNG